MSFKKTCIENSLKHRKNANRLDKLAHMCKGANRHVDMLRYSLEAKRSRELAKRWELEGFGEDSPNSEATHETY